jgi:hypothetical protein
MQKPLPSEHREYFQKYIDLVPDGNYIQVLQDNTASTRSFFKGIPAEKHDYRYAEGKWTIKEVLLHLMDTERVFSYRALTAARGDHESLLPAMGENMFAANANVSNRSIEDMLEEFEAIRTATRKLFENMTDAQTQLTVNASGHPTSARALGYMIIGHVIHHINIVQERYL